MSWEERPLEKYVQRLLSEKLKAGGEKLWGTYKQTRDELVTEILPWIAKHGDGLTDHGITHITDVIDNASMLLGFSNHFDDEDHGKQAKHGFSPHEMLVLLTGLLLHDVGNIYGRNRHNQKIDEVWSKLNSWKLWLDNEKRLIIDVGRAHSGKSSGGSPDTIKDLAVTPRYFEKFAVQLAPIAAIVRFADELAEGPQRTSRFLIENKMIEKDSQLYHHYAEITLVSIDRAGGRVALTYHINVDHPAYPKPIFELEEHLCKLLKMVYARAAKMNQERQYARHYAAVLAPFRETSISLTFLKQGIPISIPLNPVTLNDFTVPGESVGLIEELDASYNIAQLVKQVM